MTVAKWTWIAALALACAIVCLILAGIGDDQASARLCVGGVALFVVQIFALHRVDVLERRAESSSR